MFGKHQIKDVPSELVVGGLKYRYSKTNEVPIVDLVTGKKNGYAIYSLDQNSENVAKFKEMHTDVDDKKSPQNSIILAWAKNKMTLAVMPAAARFISRNRIMNAVAKGIFEGQNTIGLRPQVTVIGINGNNPIEAKTDTGADMCSMHVDSVSVDGEQVTFSINGSQYKAPLVKQLNVKQADSAGESRPVIQCSISVNGKTVRNVECNLNNRDGMIPLLLGKNFLQQGDYSVTTESVEEVDWEAVDELFEDLEQPSDNLDEIRQLVETLGSMLKMEDNGV